MAVSAWLNDSLDSVSRQVQELAWSKHQEAQVKNTIPDYMKLAKQDFLEGTTFRTPVEAVESGARKIEDWCDLVSIYRQKIATPEDRRDLAETLAHVANA
jgi:hypothetical protein